MGFYGDAFLRLTMLRPREIDPWLPQGATHARTGQIQRGRCMRRAREGAWIEYVSLDGENQRGAITASANNVCNY